MPRRRATSRLRSVPPAAWGLGALAAAFGHVAYYATPRPISDLMAELIDPEPGAEVYDPCCGTGRLLLSAHRHAQSRPGPGIAAWGQEINPFSPGLAVAARALHGRDLRLPPLDTMRRPAFRRPDGSLRRFDRILANPMWNQSFPAEVYDEDPYGRFSLGLPPLDNGDWGWVQHLLTSLRDTGRMAVILDARLTAPSGDERDAAIRAEVVERDLLEAVILCSAPADRPRTSVRGFVLAQGLPTGGIYVFNRAKRHPGEVLLVDGAPLLGGYIRRELGPQEALGTVLRAHRDWQEEPGVAAIAANEAIARDGYDFTPARHLA